MDARTHTWIAIRAVALLEEKDPTSCLLKLLKPHLYSAYVGAWIPDQADAKKGDAGSMTENHILKMAPYTWKVQKKRFTLEKEDLLKKIGMQRMTAQFLKADTTLGAGWWSEPYEGNIPKPGQHLPNRIMAMSTMLKDLLLMGDTDVDQLTMQVPDFARFMLPDVRTHDEAVAMYLFMLSHFVADVSMPCHCDARRLSKYGNGLHEKLEKHWSDKVGDEFEKDCIANQPPDVDRLLGQARAVDQRFGLRFAVDHIPSLHPKQDAWLEAIFLCRASFAIASIIAPPKTYAYDSQALAPFKVVLGNGNGELLEDLDTALLHDAVLNTAIFWQDLWTDVAKP